MVKWVNNNTKANLSPCDGTNMATFEPLVHVNLEEELTG